MKNTLIRGLVSLLKPKRNLSSEEKRFLIVSTTALGDTLWGTPAIKALRETYPHSHISVLTSPVGKEVLLHNPYINKLFVIKNPAFKSLFSIYRDLRAEHFSHVLIFHTSQRPVLPCTALLGAHTVIGSQGINKGLDFLLTERLERLPKMHEIERRLKIVEEVGAHVSSQDLELFLNEEDEEITNAWLSSLGLPSYLPMIAFHPGSKDAFRQWPATHFIKLGQRLTAHLGCKLFITGTPHEKPLVEKIASQIEGAIPVTHLPLRSFAYLIKRMRLMITNDTGPLHIAFAMKTPTIALFAPSDPDRFGPYRAKKVKVISKGTTCSPCLTRKCRSPFCFLQIGVQEVYDAALQLFYEDKGEAQTKNAWAHFNSEFKSR